MLAPIAEPRQLQDKVHSLTFNETNFPAHNVYKLLAITLPRGFLQ